MLEYTGFWGEWGDIKYVNSNQRGAAAQFRFEPHQGSGDDTAGNGLRVWFKDGSSEKQLEEAGKWGDWHSRK